MGRPRTFDKAEVLALARDAFWAKGYEATSLDDLMRATGLGKGSLYAAFGDKHRLFLEVLEAYSAGRLERARAALCGEGGEDRALARLHAFFRVEDSGHVPRTVAAVRGCFLVNSTTEVASHDDAVRTLSRCAYGTLEDLLAETVARAVEEGDLPATTDSRELGRLLLAVMQGMEFLAKSGMAQAEVAKIGQSTRERLLGTLAAARAPRGKPPTKRAKR